MSRTNRKNSIKALNQAIMNLVSEGGKTLPEDSSAASATPACLSNSPVPHEIHTMVKPRPPDMSII